MQKREPPSNWLFHGGPWKDLSDVPELIRSEVIKVGNLFYDPGIFTIQAQASYAKAVVFAAEAIVAAGRRERISAAIAAYYSLFHLCAALIYLLPSRADSTLLSYLIKERDEGLRDPTRRIRHKEDIHNFLKPLESEGLTPKLRELFEKAQSIRYFVNYGPRIVWRGDQAVFGPDDEPREPTFEPADLDEVVQAIEPLLGTTLMWTGKALTGSSRGRPVAVAAALKQFLTQPDLLYVQWCSDEVIGEARRIANGIPTPSQLLGAS